MIKLGSLLSLEYGCALPAEARSDFGFPVFGSNGEVGRHHAYIVPESGVVVGRKGSVGKIAWSEEAFWAIDTTYWVKCSSEDKRWLYWILSWLPLHRLDTSTGVPGLNRNDVYELSIFAPELGERQKIAQILDILDTVIRETEAIIAKLKAVKQGLLHDLLTRGIDANGELRPPQSEAPHLYKRSLLGWIPKDWKVNSLESYVDSDITYGIVQAGPHVPGGIPYIRTGDMSGEELERETMLCTSTRIAASYKRSEVSFGDIVIAIGATVGKVLPIPLELDGANLTQGTAKISPNSATDKDFLLWAIRHQRAQNSIQLEVKGTTFAEITLAALRKIPLAAPIDLIEQTAIGQKLESIDYQIRTERASLMKLQSQKTGLMNDLLTGRVRVTPLLELS
ncbi:restriction endonuclease subunit S [Methylomonas rhizoryzae]|uniref:restriction endonuclease subunit S n=1 Tax=Methylomonas rhizoryzae TaxID=2608981 RepID=UPI001231A399|nr:restriction endonuclease subunit S [Methylomonas rhizoryzae]